MDTLTRKRDFDLIRLILLRIEASPLNSTITNSQLNVKDYEPLIVALHVEMLVDAGFIEATIPKTLAGITPDFIVHKINWEGYEFLDNARNDTVWKQFKSEAKKIGSSMSMAVANSLLIAAAKAQLGL